MTRIIDTQKARRKTPVNISNKNTQTETSENRTTVDEAIDWLSTLPLACKDGAKAKLITDMAIEALSAEPIYCNECKHQDYCHQTVSYTKVRLGYNEHGAMPVEWCSRVERKEE